MSVIDENKLKLLKMREKLLEVSSGIINKKALDDYKDIAYEIEKEMYETVTDMIKANKEYSNESFERQLEFFSSIYDEYEKYRLFRESIENTCKKYGDNDLELSDVDCIKIDEIKKRVSSLKEYFDNLDKIERNKRELDELNKKLVDIEKKLVFFKNRTGELDNELRQGLLKSEGRIYNSVGNLEYASCVLEAESFGIDLKELLNNPLKLQQKVKDAKTELDDVNDRLKTAEICYNNRPNINYKDIYLNIRKEAINVKYKVVLLEILDLISKNTDSYEEAIEKRNKLISLKNERLDLLKQLGIKYLYDPFDRIHIKKQLEVIETYGSNLNNSKEIVSQIGRLTSDNDICVNRNRDYIEYFKTRVDLIKDNTPLERIIERETIDIKPYENTVYYADNQVVSTSNMSYNFMIDRAREKAYGVINRVYEMMNGISSYESDTYNESPQLVIEPVTKTDSTVNSEVNNNNFEFSFDDNINEDSKDENENVFLDLPFEIETPSLEKENSVNVPENDSVTNNQVFLNLPFGSEDINEEKSQTENDKVVEQSNNELNITSNGEQNNVQLFEEVKPFEDISLFDDRYDDGMVFNDQPKKELKLDYLDLSKSNTLENVNDTRKNTSSKDEMMPDAFWITKEDDNVEESPKMSFDEQIGALVESENVKTKKLVS